MAQDERDLCQAQRPEKAIAAEVIERNRSLMDLRLAALNYPDLAEYRNAGKWDEAGARDYLAELRAGNVDIEGAIRGFRNVEV